MKVAIVGDIHFSMKSSNPTTSQIFANNIKKFFSKVFFPELKKRNIKHAIFTGDVFDDRKHNSNLGIKGAKDDCFDVAEEEGIEIEIIVGNHDMHLLQKTTPNSLDLYLAEYDNVSVHSKFTQKTIGGLSIDFIPWICDDNYVEIFSKIENSKSRICVAHPEINGFQMSGSHMCEHGIDRDIFKNYEYVVAGHFHEPSRYGNIHYVGSPTQHNWGDADSKRGFYILDTETLEVEFIENPYKLFERIEYSDTLKIQDTPDVEGKFVKIILPEKYDETRYKKILEELMTFSPLDIKGIEPHINVEGETISSEEVESASFEIISFLTSYTKSIDPELDEAVLGTMYREAYQKMSEQ